jgi:DNA polymerase-3 subunit gamma/tau
MAYQVLYRKYRPRDLSEVIGQDHIVAVLKREIETGRVAHAYLFSGPRGVGKTTVARIIAKAVNCANAASVPEGNAAVELSIRQSSGASRSFGGLPIPCNTCPSCEVFNSGQALNLIEIDAASNRGIDEIRELKEGARASPAGGRYKVFIIDEAHMLTPPAWNALLKTLEEPPAHVLLILATTEFEKIPATIVSRTQKHYFKRLTLPLMVKKLTVIAAAEKIKIDAAAVELIAASAEGGMRDAESLLDQLTALSDENEPRNNQITVETVEKLTGGAGFQKISRLADLIIRKELAETLRLIVDLNDGGHNLVDLTKELTGYLRRLAEHFNVFYTQHRVISDDSALTAARLALVRATQQVLANGLGILGVNAPIRM